MLNKETADEEEGKRRLGTIDTLQKCVAQRQVSLLRDIINK
jgi:hypothetical protein